MGSTQHRPLASLCMYTLAMYLSHTCTLTHTHTHTERERERERLTIKERLLQVVMILYLDLHES